jgi:hypothetical protein
MAKIFASPIFNWVIGVEIFSRPIPLSCSEHTPCRHLSIVALVRTNNFMYSKIDYVSYSVLACNGNIQCRTFDYDSSLLVCRLFEGALDTGHIIPAAPTSRVGSLEYFPTFFSAFLQPCAQCVENRYLTCLNNTCQCPLHSFWNGSVCENQRYENASCMNNEWCRNDPFGLICSASNVCTRKIGYR